jgi:hypothetical protein
MRACRVETGQFSRSWASDVRTLARNGARRDRAAAEALRRFEPEHPSLVHLEVRFRRALQIKAMLAEILHPELATEDDEEWRWL